ncbi:MAG: hypothetical protein H0T46_20615 [Deltaproteobacteria bacterium]|nr:hypothetical protein [Deltaproteobacteria bacterium]
MVRIRHGWLVATLALGLSVGACKKSEKKTEGGGSGEAKTSPTTTDNKVAEQPAGQTAVVVPGTQAVNPNANDLSLLPVDSEVVLGLNFAQLQTSALWKKFVEPQMMKGDTQAKLAEFKAKCGFDPMASVKSISMGLKGIGADKPDGVIVVHGPDKTKVMACLDKMKEEAAKDGSTIEKDGDVVNVKNKNGENFAFTYVDDDTLVGVVGTGANTAGVKAAAAGTSALKTSAAFVDMYAKINTADSLWILMNGNSKAFDKAAAMGFKPKAVFGSVNVTDGLTMDMRVRLDTPDQAVQIANMAKGQVQQFVKMVDKLDIVAEQADVKINIALSTQKLEALIQQVAGMMGGMSGGPGGAGGPGGGSMGGP